MATEADRARQEIQQELRDANHRHTPSPRSIDAITHSVPSLRRNPRWPRNPPQREGCGRAPKRAADSSARSRRGENIAQRQ